MAEEFRIEFHWEGKSLHSLDVWNVLAEFCVSVISFWSIPVSLILIVSAFNVLPLDIIASRMPPPQRRLRNGYSRSGEKKLRMSQWLDFPLHWRWLCTEIMQTIRIWTRMFIHLEVLFYVYITSHHNKVRGGAALAEVAAAQIEIRHAICVLR